MTTDYRLNLMLKKKKQLGTFRVYKVENFFRDMVSLN